MRLNEQLFRENPERLRKAERNVQLGEAVQHCRHGNRRVVRTETTSALLLLVARQPQTRKQHEEQVARERARYCKQRRPRTKGE